MRQTPIDYGVVRKKIEESRIVDVGKASIRQLRRLVSNIEEATGERFIRMEMGIPGIPPVQVGVDAEIAALKSGVASIYSDIEGLPALKREISRFIKLFFNVDIRPEGCIATVGSCMGSFLVFTAFGKMYEHKGTQLFIDPGFPVHKLQQRVLGQKSVSFDVYAYRGEKLHDKLESYLAQGDIVSILYSSPNNPAWICFTERELQIVGELATKYDVIVVEDLAYFGMDFRHDYSQPGRKPYQPSVARYTDNYILLISSSKVFSYAGQRVGILAMSDKVFSRKVENFKKYFPSDMFGPALIYGVFYAACAGTHHSGQYALAAMLQAVNDGEYNYREPLLEYATRAKAMKKAFTDHGFKLVYDKDEDEPIADGFYFTFSYPGFTGEELLKELLFYGVSAISLSITGSERLEGLRACVSQVYMDDLPLLEGRLEKFREDHPQ